jgi:hypothetical protein
MVIHWWTLAIGLILGSALGAVADWQIGPRLRKRTELRELTRDYAGLAGRYAQYRIRINGSDAGTLEPTGHIVEIVWHPGDGLLEASAFDANGNPEWHSYIKMSREYAGTGVGHYNNVNSIHGGLQQVIYSRRTRCFSVRGTDHARKEFVHCWKPVDQAAGAQLQAGTEPARTQDGPTFNPDLA